jgi:hypothetical protein
MPTCHESGRDLAVGGEYDVIVCAGGPTGFVAAVVAASVAPCHAVRGTPEGAACRG